MTMLSIPLPTGRTTTDGVAWRSLRRGFWVARRDGRHLGAVQHGRRWLATDADGDPIAAFRTFREAQAAVADPAGHRAPLHRSGAVPSVLVVAGLLAAATASASGWAWTSLGA